MRKSLDGVFSKGETSEAAERKAVRLADSDEQASLSALPEWQLVQRIAASRGFNKSELLKNFLLYVCERSLTGDAQEITEQRIGIRIFGRPEGYDPGEDNIVRSYARMMRKRLDAYFAGEGANENLRLLVPRGAYVPVFELAPNARKPVVAELPAPFSVHQGSTHSLDDAPDEPVASISKARFHWYSAVVGMLAGCVLALLIWTAAHMFTAQQNSSAAHTLWAQMFEPSRNTLIVPADSGLGIVENLTHSQISVDAYANGSFLAQMRPPEGLDWGNFNDLSSQHYTSIVDLEITAALERLPEFTPDRTQIRYARAVTAEDIHNSNVILLGSVHSNPWVALFSSRFNFQLTYTSEVDRSFIVNQHPLTGEEAVYHNETNGTLNRTYGTVVYLSDAGGAGHVLLIQGLNMAATQAAANILFNKKVIAPVLTQAARRDGFLRPFELLVETTSIGAAAPEARVIATRIYPQ
jgi:hypothetical protein